MNNLLTGDCLYVMPTLMSNSVDSIVSDPPYGLSFMGKDWDHGVPGEHFWREALRVAKPGAHLLAFGGTRTFHRLAVAIEDAGWEIRDTIMWVYGSGFPKSLDVSKAIDKAAGRMGHATDSIKDILRKAHKGSGRTLAQLNEACGFEASGYLRDSSTWANVLPTQDKWPVIRDALALSDELDSLFAEAEREVVGFQSRGNSVNTDFMSGGNDITAPATDAARQWSGWGTALKPAWEPIIVARKPLDGTVAANVLKYGTGAINVDGCRVEAEPWTRKGFRDDMRGGNFASGSGKKILIGSGVAESNPLGRWPANLIHDGSQMVLDLFPVTTSGDWKGQQKGVAFGHNETGKPYHWNGDTGSAARFFYCAKASRQDRNEGCEGLPLGEVYSEAAATPMRDQREQATRHNNHPTIKPTAIMRYLCRLVTPPGGTVLDPFMGSGSTGKAAVLEGFSFVGIEMQPEYVEIARCRINAATDRTTEPAPEIRQADML